MASNFKAQRRNEGIKALRREFAFRLHLLTQRIGQINVETRCLAFAFDGLKRRIGGCGAKMERLGRSRSDEGCGQQQDGKRFFILNP